MFVFFNLCYGHFFSEVTFDGMGLINYYYRCL